jgi:hypothetical protein
LRRDTVSIVGFAEVDVTQPSRRSLFIHAVLAGISLVGSLISTPMLIVRAVEIGSDGRNPGGAIFFACAIAAVGVFGAARLYSVTSGRYGKNPD